MKNGRGLSPLFIEALKNGNALGLERFLQAVKKDATLCLEIRENAINIYYRGGSLTRLEERSGKYTATFDRRYILNPKTTLLPGQIKKQELECIEDVSQWIQVIPFIKQEMDLWLKVYPKDEREFQQMMVRENNFNSAAKGTDYFICDIEYASVYGRFDLIAAQWPSSASQRKNNRKVGLAFIELKYMNKSMTGTSGIISHIQDMDDCFRENTDNFAALKQEMRTIFNQKLELGLINNQKPIESFNDKMPEFILVFANHDPDSEILYRDICTIEEMAANLPFKVKFAVSNFMGYGLYQQNIYGLEEFSSRFGRQIYTKRIDLENKPTFTARRGSLIP